MTAKAFEKPTAETSNTDLRKAMFTAEDLGKRWSCSTKHVRRMADAGKIPRPEKLGSLVRWRIVDIEQWESNGCPKIRHTARGGR